MKKFLLIVTFSILWITTFAQRGKVRQEWDIDGSHYYHNFDDDMYSFLFIVFIVVIIFVVAALKGYRNDTKNKNNTGQIPKSTGAFKILSTITTVQRNFGLGEFAMIL